MNEVGDAPSSLGKEKEKSAFVVADPSDAQDQHQRPRPGFRPLSRMNSTVVREPAAEVQQTRNELDSIPLSELIKKNFGIKPSSKSAEKDDENQEDNDEIVGDTNFEGAGVSSEYVNVFKEFDDDELGEDGFERTNQYLKAEFNEPPPRRFGSRHKKSTPRWKKDETDFFYRVLSMCGTDFSMMSKFFPNRTRKMIVNKYHIEEEKNKEKVLECIEKHEPLDLNLYANTVGIDEGSIVEDFKKNKNKLVQSQDYSEAPSRKNITKTDKLDDDDWQSVSDDSSDDIIIPSSNAPTRSESNIHDPDKDSDEIEGDLDF